VVDLDKEGVDQTAKEIVEMGRKAFPVKTDLTKIDSIKEMVQKTMATFGRIDCLVNNAGTSGRIPFLEATLKILTVFPT